MPLVDGSASTRMIRALEGESGFQIEKSRVPIFAVSASLTESLREDYIADG